MKRSPFCLKGKVALVTGAARGIGAATAMALADAGANVLATDLEIDDLDNVVRSEGEGLIKFHQQDVSSEISWGKNIDKVISLFGGLDILVNNAGIHIGGKLIDNSLKEIQRIHAVNVDSIFLGMKYAAISMKLGSNAGRGGSIINLSSVAGLVGLPGHTAYGSTKGAVRLYSKQAAIEFAKLGYGIRVNSVHPGLISTSMGTQVFQDLVDIGLAQSLEEAKDMVSTMTPIGRLGNVEDVANMILFLASDASSFVTGAEFVVDGGMTAQ